MCASRQVSEVATICQNSSRQPRLTLVQSTRWRAEDSSTHYTVLTLHVSHIADYLEQSRFSLMWPVSINEPFAPSRLPQDYLAGVYQGCCCMIDCWGHWSPSCSKTTLSIQGCPRHSILLWTVPWKRPGKFRGDVPGSSVETSQEVPWRHPGNSMETSREVPWRCPRDNLCMLLTCGGNSILWVERLWVLWCLWLL